MRVLGTSEYHLVAETPVDEVDPDVDVVTAP